MPGLVDDEPVGADGDPAGILVEDVVAADEPGDELGGRRVEHLAWRAGLLDPAVVHDDDQIGQGQRLVLRVGDVDEADAECPVQLLELEPHAHPQERIEGRERLVEQQDRRLHQQRPGECHALLLAARELVGKAIREVGHVDQGQDLARPRRPLGLVDATHAQAEGDIVDDGQMRKQRIALEHHGGAARRRGEVGDVDVAEHDVAAAHRFVAGDHPQGRRLAAAGRPKQTAIGAAGNALVDSCHREGVTIGLGNRHQFQR